MQDALLHEFWRALSFQLPCITAYLIGISLALRYRSRFPLPCMYLLMGCGLKLLNAVVYSAAVVVVGAQGDVAAFECVHTTASLVDALGYGLFFLAIFHGRKAPPPQTAWHEHWDDDEEPPPAPSNGVKNR